MILKQPPLIIDTNVFIAAHNTYYAPDICPGFWGAMVSCYHQGRIHSIGPVEYELAQDDTELSRWVEGNLTPLGFFRSVEDDSAVRDEHETLIEWARQNTNYEEAAVTEFADVADSWLIAYAKVHSAVIITNEVPSNSLRKIKIPNACAQFGIERGGAIKHGNTFQMLRALKVKFDLRQPPR